jgi:hypothetical protein
MAKGKNMIMTTVFNTKADGKTTNALAMERRTTLMAKSCTTANGSADYIMVMENCITKTARFGMKAIGSNTKKMVKEKNTTAMKKV